MIQLQAQDHRQAMNVRIPTDAYLALKKYAHRRDKSMNKVIADLIRENLMRPEK